MPDALTHGQPPSLQEGPSHPNPAGTILDVLRFRARMTPGRIGIRLIKDAEGGSESLSAADLFSLARQGQAALRARGVCPGDRLLVLLPTGEAYLAVVLGAMLEGVIPASLGLPPAARSSDGFLEELDHHLRTLVPALLVVTEGVKSLLREKVPHLPPLLTDREISPAHPDPFPSGDGHVRPVQISHIQLSSGSTGRPKGIVLSHRGLMANLEAMRERLRLTPDHVGVSWLPMFHDMGFIGSLLLPLYVGFEANLMDPSLFVANPLLWLKLISRLKATITPGPPSALGSCLRLIERRGMIGLDMGRWEIATIGAEPIPSRLIHEFRRVMGAFGVRPETLRPVYGLAEATLAVTCPEPGIPPRVDWIDACRMEQTGEAVPVPAGDPKAYGWVSVGLPVAGTTIRILGEDGQELPERRVGRIVIDSPSLMIGSFEDGALRPHQGPGLDTGDLGYLADGELFITGRRSDIIIKWGRNISPERLEELAWSVPGVQAGRVAAFGLWDEAAMTERVIVLVETSLKKTGEVAAFDRLRLAIKARLQQAGYDADQVMLVPKGWLPRTSSGKIRRRRCRELYLADPGLGGRGGP